ncbi:hypothetical protein PAI11_23390 [Patulibacter medicamentivorans]|uniref:Uncharacterized protein n=1 Tax=Patulibacter medicamentivorans TaxID=1097667 RepID=H0E689_9ACTN|nr:hypothetical protein [Patulibacter medicamentivorans]EHN10787.1 hypothetical protein PAI11_23390 [Patulibacter medicamentivorans]
MPLVGLGLAGTAQAYEIDNFSAKIVQQDGTTFEAQAGGHPYQGIISFDTTKLANGNNDGQTQTIRVDTPPGLVPNPEAVPHCAQTQLEANACPPASQVGSVALRLSKVLSAPGTGNNPFNLPFGTRGDLVLTASLYNMEVEAGQLARFSFNPTQAPNGSGHIVDIEGAMRPGDNGLYFTINHVARPTADDPATPENEAATPTLTGSTLTFWGTPGATAHDGTPAPGDTAGRGEARVDIVSIDGGAPRPAQVPPIIGYLPPTGATGITDTTSAFLNNPTVCDGPKQATLTLDSYQGDRDTQDYTVESAPGVGLTGCDQVPFSQTTTFGPSAVQRDAPAPLGVTLDVPQTSDTGTLATAHVKKVAVTLPPGMTISPSAATGLEACTDAQFGKGTNDPIACSAASRIGVVSIKSPALANPLTGAVYVGQPQAGNRYRLFVNADGYGISVRLKGDVRPDPVTGQVTAVFDDNPQLPFSQFKLDFDGGSKAIIATPQTCGTATGSSTLTPWSGNPASSSAPSVSVVGCDGFPFAPGFGATAASTKSGAYAPLKVDFTRPDGNQFLSGISAKLPPGMLAKLKGVTRCSEAQVAAEACPESSRIGTTSVTAGPGDSPYPLSGPVYLTGPYNGGSFGTVNIIRAVAGPYDLGNVVVRQALKIDPDTAQVSVVSDPLPQIKEGIVLRLRNLQLNVDRSGFMRNPTSCGTGQITTDLTSALGAAAQRSASLTFGECASLPFKPKIALSFRDNREMRKLRHPRVVATVTQREGEAGVKSTSVAMPLAVALAADNANGLCEKADAARDACPANSMVGTAVAETPILDKPLKGPIYFVKGIRTDPKTGQQIKTLPTLFVPLRGETQIYLRATTAVSRNRLVTTFANVPDAPITKFTLTINGGKHGIIAAARDICATPTWKASVRMAGHNGKAAPTAKPTIATACGPTPKLRLGKVRRSGATLTVPGTLVKTAKKRVSVRVTCGKSVARGSAKPRKGRYSARVRLTGACARAKTAKVAVSVPKDGRYRAATVSRTVRLR